MSDAIETYEVSPTERIVVSYDEDASSECPRDWQENISVHRINQNTRYHAPSPGTDSHGDQLEEIFQNVGVESYRSGYQLSDEITAAVVKHFERAGLPFIIAEHNADRDWVGTFIWYLEPKEVEANRALSPDWDPMPLLDGCIETYRQWANGEVYNLDYQKLHTWTDDADGTKRSTWETEDSLGGNYFDPNDEDEVLSTAREHFAMTEKD
jgi:hypothetical protein